MEEGFLFCFVLNDIQDLFGPVWCCQCLSNKLVKPIKADHFSHSFGEH